ncbi:MAG TPA: aminoacyl-tRNA hydrolase [Candidatus Paceibacterota bacterium]
MIYVVGLGNPGEEYTKSRHNTGKMAVECFEAKSSKSEFRNKIKIIESGEFMNHSGKAVVKYIKSKKTAKDLIVVYDDMDLPLGTIKISYDKSSGGHKGLESIIKSIKTKEFTRVRIGVSPATPSGKIKKPQGEKEVIDFILSNFTPKQNETLKKTFKLVSEAIETIVEEGREIAMNRFN